MAAMMSLSASASICGSQAAHLGAPRRAPGAAAPRRVQTQAFFNFGGGDKGGAGAPPSVCVECGYIYKGDLSKEPFNYTCPECGVGKWRFKKMPQNNTSYYNSMAAQKAANKKEAAKKRKGSARAKLREQAMKNMRDKDQGKQGGLFGRK